MNPQVIMVRYGEIGLKSPPVRKKFERTLVNTIERAFVECGIEAILSRDGGRIYVDTSDVGKALSVLKRTFGIVSLSPAWTSGSDLDEIKEAAAKLWKDSLSPGQSFAVRARRSGNHPYTSMELASEIGSVIWEVNLKAGPKVDLSNPDREFFVEVRDNKTYLFSDVIQGVGGLPIGTQGVVGACLNDEMDVLAAWLLMKRGCYIDACGSPELIEVLKGWDSGIHVVSAGSLRDLCEAGEVNGLVSGETLENFEGKVYDCPVFYPLIGMDDEEIERLKEVVLGK